MVSVFYGGRVSAVDERVKVVAMNTRPKKNERYDVGIVGKSSRNAGFVGQGKASGRCGGEGQSSTFLFFVFHFDILL